MACFTLNPFLHTYTNITGLVYMFLIIDIHVNIISEPEFLEKLSLYQKKNVLAMCWGVGLGFLGRVGV